MDSKHKFKPNGFDKFKGNISGYNPIGLKESYSSKIKKGQIGSVDPPPLSDRDVIGRADSTWRKMVVKPNAVSQPVVRNIAAEARVYEDTLAMLIDKESITSRVLQAGEIRKVHSLIRQMGRVHQLAKEYRKIPAGIDEQDLQQVGLSRTDYYDSLVQLGGLKFGKTIPDTNSIGWSFRVEYPCVSGLFQDELPSCGTGTLTEEVNVKLYSKGIVKNRSSVTVVPAQVNRTAYSRHFSEMLMINKPGADQMARGLHMDKLEGRNLRMDVVSQVIQKAVGSCRIMRFVKLWSYYLWLLDSGKDEDMRLPKYTIARYDGKGVSDVAAELVEGKAVSTVIWADKHESKTKFLVLAAEAFPFMPLKTKQGYAYFGGFEIPSEVSEKGTIFLLGMSSKETSEVNQDIKINANEAYSIICDYTIGTDSYDDCLTGYCLAMALYSSDGLVHFSIPKSQGLADLLAPVYAMTGNRKLPPVHFNRYALLGAMVVNRQSMLLAKDMSCYLVAGYGDDTETDMHHCLAREESRRVMYGTFAMKFFTTAFELNYYIDPLQMRADRETSTLDAISYTQLYWSVCRPATPLRNSFLASAVYGHWQLPDNIRACDPETQRAAVGTYVSMGIVEDCKPSTNTLNLRGVRNNPQFTGIMPQLVPGNLTMVPGNIQSRLRRIQRPSFVGAIEMKRIEPGNDAGLVIIDDVDASTITRSRVSSLQIVDDDLNDPLESPTEYICNKTPANLNENGRPMTAEPLREEGAKSTSTEYLSLPAAFNDDVAETIPPAAVSKDGVTKDQMQIEDGSDIGKELDSGSQKKGPPILVNARPKPIRLIDTSVSSGASDSLGDRQSGTQQAIVSEIPAWRPPTVAKRFTKKFVKEDDYYLDDIPEDMQKMNKHFIKRALGTEKLDSSQREGKAVTEIGKIILEEMLEMREYRDNSGKYKTPTRHETDAAVRCAMFEFLTGERLKSWQVYYWTRIIYSICFYRELWRAVKRHHYYRTSDEEVRRMRSAAFVFERIPTALEIGRVFDKREDFERVKGIYTRLERIVGFPLTINGESISNADYSRVDDYMSLPRCLPEVKGLALMLRHLAPNEKDIAEFLVGALYV